MSPYIPWLAAWEQAHYGPDGFYARESNPEPHFRTGMMEGSTRIEQLFTELVTQFERIGKPKDFTVLDAGSGNDALARSLKDLASQHGLHWHIESHNYHDGDLREIDARGGAGAVVAHELLDDIPCTIAELDENLRAVRIDVDPQTGHESVGDHLLPAEVAWLERWWPPTVAFARREIGITRDLLMRRLLGLFDSGCMIMIDYCTTQGARTSGQIDAGTLIGYQHGRPTRPVPDGLMNITAHVALESLVAQALEHTGSEPRTWRESAQSDFHWLVQPL